jgi:hypothetical protein
MTDHPTLPFENRLGPSHHNAPETSALAAIATKSRTGEDRVTVLLAIYHDGWIVLPHGGRARGGLTLDEIANRTGLIANTVRPRRKELERSGLVVDSGLRRSSNMGKPAVVWCLTDEGWRAAKELTDG